MKEDTQGMPEDIYLRAGSQKEPAYVLSSELSGIKYIRADLALQQKPAVLEEDVSAFDPVQAAIILTHIEKSPAAPWMMKVLAHALQSSAVEVVSHQEVVNACAQIYDEYGKLSIPCTMTISAIRITYPEGLKIITDGTGG